MPIVRACDLGSGWTKYSFLKDGKLHFGSFPSLAPQHSGRNLSGAVYGKRDTVVVNVEGTLYEVGPDSAELENSTLTRNLNDQYIYSDQYKALMLGALSYMGEAVIDLLVVGLPLNTIHLAQDLKNICMGTHKVAVTGSETVTVKDVMVMPQPLGGYVYCLSQAASVPEFEFLEDEANLVIDPGYLTLDFLVTAGKKVNEARSGAHPGGVSKVLRAICESLSNKFGVQFDNLSAVEKGLQRRKMKVNGQVEDLTPHIRYAKPALEGSINFLRNVAGDGSDIDNLILLGGGGRIFEKTLMSTYRNHKILVLPDAQMANCKGFQIAGEEQAGGKPVPRADKDSENLPTVISYAEHAAATRGAPPAPQPTPSQPVDSSDSDDASLI